MVDIAVQSPLNPTTPPQATPPQANGNGGAPQPAPQAAVPEPEAAKDVPAQPEEQQSIWQNGKAKLPLRKKVNAHGDLVSELTFREPTGGDFERVGNPVILSIFEANPKPIYDAPVMTAMMSHLAGVPTSTIRALDPRDWQNGALMLFNFFVPDRWVR